MRYGVYKKGFSFPLYVFDNEDDARSWVLSQSDWSDNFYYEKM